MDFETRFREALTPHHPGADFAARIMALVGSGEVIDIRTRRRSRFVLFGAVVAVGVAAAMLAWQMTEKSNGPQPVVVVPVETSTDVAVIAPPPPSGQEVAREPTAAAAVIPPLDVPRRYTVLVMPAADQSGDTAVKPGTEAFLAALVQEFQRIPDIDLVFSSTASEPEAASADFRFTVTSLAARTLPTGYIQVTPNDSCAFESSCASLWGRENETLLGPDHWPTEARIDATRPAQASSTGREYLGVSLFVGGNGAPSATTGCHSSGNFSSRQSRRISDTPSIWCLSAAQIVARLTEVMRPQSVDTPRTQPSQMPASIRIPGSLGASIFNLLMGNFPDKVDTTSISEEEFEKLLAYSKYARAADQEVGARETENMCAGKDALTTLDAVAAALTKIDTSSIANRERLGNEAAKVLGERLGSLLNAAVRRIPSTGFATASITDYKAMMIYKNKEPRALIEKICSSVSAP